MRLPLLSNLSGPHLSHVSLHKSTLWYFHSAQGPHCRPSHLANHSAITRLALHYTTSALNPARGCASSWLSGLLWLLLCCNRRLGLYLSALRCVRCQPRRLQQTRFAVLLLIQVLTQMQLRGHLDLHMHDWGRQNLLKRNIRPGLTAPPAAAGGLLWHSCLVRSSHRCSSVGTWTCTCMAGGVRTFSRDTSGLRWQERQLQQAGSCGTPAWSGPHTDAALWAPGPAHAWRGASGPPQETYQAFADRSASCSRRALVALLLGQVLAQMQLCGHLDLHLHGWGRQDLLKRHIRPSLTGAPAAAGGLLWHSCWVRSLHRCSSVGTWTCTCMAEGVRTSSRDTSGLR